jgi:tetratricopeptide (TPR) repeat protein
MKSLTAAGGILLTLLALSGHVLASENARIFMDGTAAYAKGDFPAAVEAFASLADKGVENGRLFYNLGNAYLKNGDLGHAMLWYERALKRTPDDPDLRFLMRFVMSPRPTTAGISMERAMIAVWEVLPPRSVTKPRTRVRSSAALWDGVRLEETMMTFRGR